MSDYWLMVGFSILLICIAYGMGFIEGFKRGFDDEGKY